MSGAPERDAPERAARDEGPARTSDALRTAGAAAGADLEARLARQRVASALFGAGAPVGQAERDGQGGTPAETIGGRYVLERQLGAGGMGVVYAAWDPELERRVAIKLIHEEIERAATRARLGAPIVDAAAGAPIERSAKAQTRMLREARALARLSHPNVIHVYDVGTHEGHLFVAMELVEGQTLRRWLDREPRDPRRIMEHLLASGRGLEAAHRSGLVHRDFKPENVLIGADGRVRVVDFGLARLLEPVDTVETEAPVGEGTARGEDGVDTAQPSDAAGGGAPAIPHEGGVARQGVFEQLTLAGVLVGTPRYMAPEQLEGLPADAASDQFAFCVVAWEALTGRPPFAVASVGALRAAIRAGALERPASASEELGRPPEVRAWLAMLERGLLHEPGRRWASLTELLAALSLALAKPKPRRRTSRRSIALAVLVGAAGMAALPLIFGQRQGLRAAPLPEIVASASTHAARHVASHRASAADAASDAGATLSPGPSPGPDRGPDLEPGTGPAASPAERGLEATAAAAGVTPPNTDDAASGQTVSGVGKAEAVSRDVCHLHEDTYELLVRGPRKKQLIDAGECFECRLERRRSRTSRFSPGDCGAYALCAPAGEDACP